MSLEAGELLKVLVFGLLLTLGGLFLFFRSFSRLRLWRLIGNTPTSRARSAAMGFVELSGRAAEDKPAVKAPLSSIPCVWWRFRVEEERSRVSGRGHRETHWETLTDRSSELAFFLRDATGQVRVDPRGAEIDSPPRLRRVCGGLLGDPLPAGLDKTLAPGLLGRRRRYTEWRIEPARTLYALGYLRRFNAVEEPWLGKGEGGEPFFLATRNEAEASRALLWAVAGHVLGGLGLFGTGLFLCLRSFVSH